jgi:hypothetical protein
MAIRFFRELDEKHLDRALFDFFADEVRAKGAVACRLLLLLEEKAP